MPNRAKPNPASGDPRKAVIIGVTAFKGKCLGLLDRVASGKLDRIVLTRRGRPVAEVTAVRQVAAAPYVSSYGCMRGAVVVAPGIDLTEPLNADTDAARGIAYRNRGGKDVGYGEGSSS